MVRHREHAHCVHWQNFAVYTIRESRVPNVKLFRFFISTILRIRSTIERTSMRYMYASVERPCTDISQSMHTHADTHTQRERQTRNNNNNNKMYTWAMDDMV